MVEFNTLPGADAEQRVLACCASPEWAAEIVADRPYPTLEALLDHSTRILGNLSWAEIRTALDAHPRIGQTPAGAGREAAWSRREQSAAADPGEATRSSLIEANRAYEKRFGHVFLIFATGRTADEILAEARRRVAADEPSERDTVRAELTRIVALRLTRLVTDP